MGGGDRRGAALPDRLGRGGLDPVLAQRRLGALGDQPGLAARLHPAARLHAPAPELADVRGRAAPGRPARLAALPVRRHPGRGPRPRQDREHLPGEHPVGLRGEARRVVAGVLGAGEPPRPGRSRDDPADRLGGGGAGAVGRPGAGGLTGAGRS